MKRAILHLQHKGTDKMNSIDGTGPQGLVTDSDTENFVTDVIEASKNVPVLVDFWAPWCGPCKQLGPALEKVVKEAGGAVRMVKINVDENQSLAGQMGVQSIPAVFAFKDGQPVDVFMGALPESELKAFIEKLGVAAPATQGESDLEAAREALANGDLQTAAQGFVAVLREDKENLEAVAGLATVHLEMDAPQEARQTIELLPANKQNDPVLAPVLARLELIEKTADLGETGELAAKIEQNPDDHQARYDLALLLNAAGDRADAVHHLTEIVKRDAGWNEGAARLQLLQFFDAWGPTDPMTIEGRRQLSLILFS